MRTIVVGLTVTAAFAAGALSAKPIKEAAKHEIEAALKEAANPTAPRPTLNPPRGPKGFTERVGALLKDEFSPIVHSKAKDFEESQGPKPLSPHDQELGVNAKGSPKVPSKCSEGGGTGCGTCFASAQADLKHLRFSLEKLRVIGSWTKKFTDKSIAFGDSVSGVHGVAGLGWQPERAKIQASYESFGKAYDSKYNELIGDLERALRDVGRCEAQYFGTNDWYDRYGFIYYTFMADRYRRDD
jgi:hypothetical protein